MRKIIYCLFMLALISVGTLCSCSKDDATDNGFVNSKTEISIPGTGATESILLNTAEYNVVEIINLNDQSPIKGDISLGLDKDHPQQMFSDTQLALASTEYGSLKADFGEYGFTIDRYTGKTLRLSVQENKSRNPFKFAIILQAGSRTQQVTIMQEASHTYHFKSIEYSLQSGDGALDPYWYDDTAHAYKKDLGKSEISLEWNFTPSYIMNRDTLSAMCTATFTSDDSGAFGWLSDVDSNPDVKVPVGVTGGTIRYLSKTKEYDNGNKGLLVAYPLPDFIKVLLTGGTNTLHLKYEMQKTIISYTLTLTDLQAKNDRIIKGKWLLIQPTGKYELVNVK